MTVVVEFKCEVGNLHSFEPGARDVRLLFSLLIFAYKLNFDPNPVSIVHAIHSDHIQSIMKSRLDPCRSCCHFPTYIPASWRSNGASLKLPLAGAAGLNGKIVDIGQYCFVFNSCMCIYASGWEHKRVGF